MKLFFKQRVFSWLDSYDVYDEQGQAAYRVEGKLAWGHRLEIFTAQGTHLGSVREEVFTFLPRFRLYEGQRLVGEIKKEFTLFKPSFTLSANGWRVKGDLMAWEYEIIDPLGTPVAHISKQLFHLSDTYIIDVANPAHALTCLMIVLAIDAAKCSDGNG